MQASVLVFVEWFRHLHMYCDSVDELSYAKVPLESVVENKWFLMEINLRSAFFFGGGQRVIKGLFLSPSPIRRKKERLIAG